MGEREIDAAKAAGKSYDAKSIKVLGGTRGGPQASGDVHWLDGRDGLAPSGLGSGGQLGRRGAGRILRRDQRRRPRRQFRHRHRQRPRHSRRHACDGEEAGRRSGDDGAARRRQVRHRHLQGLRRFARRGRLCGERAFGLAGSGNLARRQGVGAELRVRQAHIEARGDRQDAQDRDEDHLPSRSGNFRRNASTATTCWRSGCASSPSSTRG